MDLLRPTGLLWVKLTHLPMPGIVCQVWEISVPDYNEEEYTPGSFFELGSPDATMITCQNGPRWWGSPGSGPRSKSSGLSLN